MRLSNSEIVGLRVETVSGRELGILLSFDVDIKNHLVEKYYVGASGVIKRLLNINAPLIISPNQIISFDNEKIIVSDLVVSELSSIESDMSLKANVEISGNGFTVSSTDGAES
jgi:sporulation protein YlmC with PRC-barrel domain